MGVCTALVTMEAICSVRLCERVGNGEHNERERLGDSEWQQLIDQFLTFK